MRSRHCHTNVEMFNGCWEPSKNQILVLHNIVVLVQYLYVLLRILYLLFHNLWALTKSYELIIVSNINCLTFSINFMTSISIWNQNLFYNLTLFFLTSLKKSTPLKIITSLCYEKTSNLKAMKLHTETYWTYLRLDFGIYLKGLGYGKSIGTILRHLRFT